VWEILKGVSFCYECIGLINSVQRTPSTSASVLSIEVASRVVISFPRSNLVSRLLFVLAKIAALLRVAGVTAALAESNGSLPPGFMTYVTCRLTAKNRDQLRNPTLGNRVWATFTFLVHARSRTNWSGPVWFRPIRGDTLRHVSRHTRISVVCTTQLLFATISLAGAIVTSNGEQSLAAFNNERREQLDGQSPK